ncbi:gliding motility protein GldB [Carboxylicivirga sp. RSCT41]|uniref:gliding motility lipoprotein GldB n=1 Tax=Carboxylicivirga agarovorans TaxID=3417570 RepID=UPI003D3402B8
MKQVLFILTVFALILGACNSSKGPDVSHIHLSVEPQLFFIDLFEMNEDDLDNEIIRLHQKYGTYLDAYSQQIIKIGSPSSPNYNNYLSSFLNYEDNKDVFKACKEQYSDTKNVAEDLTEAFKHYKYYFPEAEIPQVYLHTSYFHQNLAMDSGWVSISVENYLGADCEFYEWLAKPLYLRQKMIPEKLVPDIMKAMAIGNFSFETKNEDVISKMISQGKVHYFIKQMIPDIQDTLLFDFSEVQFKWCENYEADIWASMVEQKHLYETNRMVIQKYVGDSPFTYYFGNESPGKAAVFLGYKIIEAYMKNNPDTSLEDLLNIKDGHLILQEARYRP